MITWAGYRPRAELRVEGLKSSPDSTTWRDLGPVIIPWNFYECTVLGK